MAGAKVETAVLVAIAATRGLDDEIVTRCPNILDALATISVSAPQHEVFAVGAQIGSGRVILTLSTNAGVSEATIAYHIKIWDILGRLAKYYRYRKHQKANQKYTQPTPNKSALIAKEEDLPKDYLELVYLVYQHCLPKWKRRLGKGYDRLRPYIISLEKRVADKKLDPNDEAFVKLYYVMKEIEHFHLTAAKDILASPREEFVDRMHCIYVNIIYLADNCKEQVRTILAHELRDEPMEWLWRYFHKAKGFQAAITDLERFSRSNRSNSILAKQLVINPLPAQLGDATPKAEDWGKVTDTIFKGYQRTPRLKEKIKKAAEKHGDKSIPVHCELKVLHSFVSQKWSYPPLSYIGGSKLACMGCWCVFESWNATHEHSKYRIQGSHGKWYYPWAMPVFPDGDPATQATAENVKQRIFNRLDHKDLVKLLSDGSVPSDTSELTVKGRRVDKRVDEYLRAALGKLEASG